jgi:hypothetical protein
VVECGFTVDFAEFNTTSMGAVGCGLSDVGGAPARPTPHRFDPVRGGGLWQAEALRDGDEPVAESLDLVDDLF